jgi:hypothetical protein
MEKKYFFIIIFVIVGYLNIIDIYLLNLGIGHNVLQINKLSVEG